MSIGLSVRYARGLRFKKDLRLWLGRDLCLLGWSLLVSIDLNFRLFVRPCEWIEDIV